MLSFVDEHRADYGVESNCETLPIATSTYYEYKAREADPERAPPRAGRELPGRSGGDKVLGVFHDVGKLYRFRSRTGF